MFKNYKRNDHQLITLLQRPPSDQVNPPRETKRRQRWGISAAPRCRQRKVLHPESRNVASRKDAPRP